MRPALLGPRFNFLSLHPAWSHFRLSQNEACLPTMALRTHRVILYQVALFLFHMAIYKMIPLTASGTFNISSFNKHDRLQNLSFLHVLNRGQ